MVAEDLYVLYVGFLGYVLEAVFVGVDEVDELGGWGVCWVVGVVGSFDDDFVVP